MKKIIILLLLVITLTGCKRANVYRRDVHIFDTPTYRTYSIGLTGHTELFVLEDLITLIREDFPEGTYTSIKYNQRDFFEILIFTVTKKEVE